MAGDSRLAPARWSRHVTRWLECPPVTAASFFDWLMDFGRREPGHVLYPTCDDLAWLVADRARELGRYFRLYPPDSRSILTLLDKRALHELCDKVGVATLPTVFPRDPEEASRLTQTTGYPLLLKARTQILLESRSKGDFVGSPAELPQAYRRFLCKNPFHPEMQARVPGIELPMMQAFREQAAENIYSISGFVARGQAPIVARAAVKVLQRPRRLGVGLCFEEAPVDPAVLEGIKRICREVQYFGVFEAEFVREGGRACLIDFNPRFYGQMGFEIARDLPLAYLTWLGALGEDQALAAELSRAAAWREGRGYVYCNRFFLNLMVSLQGLSGRMTREEVRGWQRWLRDSSDRALAFDSMDAPGDRLPALVSAVRDLWRAARYPRSFLRQMVIGP
jgi:predicted ATP-grasp superfamily ATP-dependent carboligase